MKCVYCQTELSKEWPFNNCGTCPRAHEAVLGSEFGSEMAKKFATDKGRALPLDHTEFAGMLAIAFMLGRQSVDIGSSANADRFSDWLCREMPAGTIIGHPRWWVPRILKAVRHAEKSAETTTAPAFLCNATRFKLAFGAHGETFAFAGYDKELHGKWVALVDATDGAHLKESK